jgi:lysyl-tRNA synthetase class II
MIDHVNMTKALERLGNGIAFRDIAEACHRGAIVGIEGYPGRTAAGEFTIIATDFSLLSSCDINLPMMNWSHKKTLKDSEQRF